jgi:hypothetical protein
MRGTFRRRVGMMAHRYLAMFLARLSSVGMRPAFAETENTLPSAFTTLA